MKGVTRSPALVIVFSIITCSIYLWYWLYKTSDELRMYMGDSNINPAVDLILSIICFPYLIYWMYKYGKIISQAQAKAGLPVEDNSILYIILAIFGFAWVNAAIMQSSLNTIWANS